MLPYGIDIPKDVLAHLPVFMSEQEALTNEGRLFFIKGRFEAQETPLVLFFRMGSKCTHGIAILEASGKTKIDVIEGITILTEGTPVNIRNFNRHYADNTTEAKAFINGTYSGGTVIRPAQAGFGSTPGKAQAGSAGESLKMIFEHNMDYAYLITPTVASDVLIEAIIWEELPWPR